MKPICVTMQAFGTYTKPVCIDFTRLSDHHIFLITGATGGGKTTILDAMCFALYCRATGGMRSWSDMRNISSDDKTETFVDFSFMLGKEEYRFRRSLRVHFVRGSGRRELRDEHECFQKKEGDWVLLTTGSESKVRDYAEKLIGLDCEQFSKVMILPQGEFRSLIMANSSEKAKIFQKLFDADRWGKLTDVAQKLTKQLKDSVDEVRFRKEAILKTEEIESLEELQEKENRMSQQFHLAAEEEKAVDNLLKKYNQQYEQLKQLKRKEELLVKKELELTEQREIRIKAEVSYRKIEEEKKELPALKLRVKQYEAELITLERVLQKVKKIDELTDLKEQLIGEHHKEQGKKDVLKKRIQSLNENIEKGESYIQDIIETVEFLPSLFVEKETLQTMEQAYVAMEASKKECKKQQNVYDELKAEYEKQCVKQEALKAQLYDAERLFGQNITLTLAAHLKEGEPCPVCGSKVHPNPAREMIKQSDIPAEKQIELLKKSIQKEEETLQEVRSDMTVAFAKLKNDQNEYQKQIAICDQFCTDWKTLQIRSEKLKKQLEEAQKAQSLLPQARKRLQKRKEEQKDLIEQIEQIEKEEQKILQKLEIIKVKEQTVLDELPMGRESCGEVHQTIKSYRIKLSDVQTKIDEIETSSAALKTELMVAKANEERIQQELLRQKNEYQQENSKVCLKSLEVNFYESECRRLTDKSKDLSEKVGSIKQRIQSIQKTEASLKQLQKKSNQLEEEYSKFARVSLLLQGNNAGKMPIKMFVLSIMFDDILSAANLYFSQFSCNRYSLSRVKEGGIGRGFRGLEIEVFDAYFGGVRTIDTLSGGELFLASLSLAFGLSDVVQSYAGGVRLDSIFIDEGFGSLDEETLDTAMKALKQIQKMGRTVGIISHVSELKNRIAAKFVVYQSEDGYQNVMIKS